MDQRITEQYVLYNQLKTSINKLEKSLKYQQSIKTHKIIPNKHKPAHKLIIAQPNDDALQSSFNKDFNKIYFTHLNRVIISNSITLEVKKARLQSIIENTENFLANSTEPPEYIHKAYNNFLQHAGITDKEPCPSLKKKLKQVTLSHCSPAIPTALPPISTINQPLRTNQITPGTIPLTTTTPTYSRNNLSSPSPENESPEKTTVVKTRQTHNTNMRMKPLKLNRKRQHEQPHPKGKKAPTINIKNHFLELRHSSLPNQT